MYSTQPSRLNSLIMPKAGPLNLITDVAGVLVGHATDESLQSGVSVLHCTDAMTAAVDVRGGGPGTRETDLLKPENLVDQVNAIVLTGGSVFGLGAADGVVAELSAQGIGLTTSKHGPKVPIVPAAVLHDLANQGDKDWGTKPPYSALGRHALKACAPDFDLGSVGAGRGASAGKLNGGIGSTSIDLGEGVVVGALAAVNCVGSVTLPDKRSFYAWPYEIGDEFGGATPPAKFDLSDPFPIGGRLSMESAIQAGTNTTLAVVATSLDLSSSELQRVSMMAHDGLARAVRPAHAPSDGDVVFAISSGAVEAPGYTSLTRAMSVARIGSAAADCLARAIARGVYHANPDLQKERSAQ